MSANEITFGPIIDAAADAAEIPRAALRAIVWCESEWLPTATRAEPGGDGSYGLCQVTLSTARDLGFAGAASALLDPATNAQYGAQVFAGALQQAQAYAPAADALTWLQMAASAYNGGFRPSLGFGAPATRVITDLCLERDATTGACTRSVNVPIGSFGNQAYVDHFTSYFQQEGGDVRANSASSGGEDSSTSATGLTDGSPPSSALEQAESWLELNPGMAFGLAAVLGIFALLFFHQRSTHSSSLTSVR